MVSEKPSVRAPEFWEPRPAYRTKQRDAYFRQTRGIDPAILADELGLNEAFVRMYQRKLGIRACMQKPRRGTAMIRFIAVNDRTPRADGYCALCCEPVKEPYVREIQTRLLYCDHLCFRGHEQMAILAIEFKARSVS